MSAETPEFHSSMVHPSNPGFYTGSTTQISSDPIINKQGSNQNAYPNGQPQQQIYSSEKQLLGASASTMKEASEAKEEEDEETIVSTNKQPNGEQLKDAKMKMGDSLQKPTLAQHVSVGDINSSAADLEAVRKESQIHNVPILGRTDMIKTKSWKDLTKEEDEDFE